MKSRQSEWELNRRRMLAWTAAVAGGAAFSAEAADGSKAVSRIPEDGKIIFASPRAGQKDPFGIMGDALYACTIEGKNVTRLTHTVYAHNHFEVSPDRRYILCNRYSKGDANGDGKYFAMTDFKQLWLLDTHTGEERTLAPDHDAGWGGVAWAPDSRHIYFSTGTKKQVMDIYRMDVVSGEMEPVTSNLNRLMGHQGEAKFVSDTCCSRDGKWLVFVYVDPAQMADFANHKPKIAAMRTDGSEAHMVSDGGPLPPQKRGSWTVGDFDPDISADNNRVCFARATDVGFSLPGLETMDIIATNLDGTGVTQVSPKGQPDTHGIPSWGEGSDGRILCSQWSAPKDATPIILDPTGRTPPIRVNTGGFATHSQWIPG